MKTVKLISLRLITIHESSWKSSFTNFLNWRKSSGNELRKKWEKVGNKLGMNWEQNGNELGISWERRGSEKGYESRKCNLICWSVTWTGLSNQCLMVTNDDEWSSDTFHFSCWFHSIERKKERKRERRNALFLPQLSKKKLRRNKKEKARERPLQVIWIVSLVSNCDWEGKWYGRENGEREKNKRERKKIKEREREKNKREREREKNKREREEKWIKRVMDNLCVCIHRYW